MLRPKIRSFEFISYLATSQGAYGTIIHNWHLAEDGIAGYQNFSPSRLGITVEFFGQINKPFSFNRFLGKMIFYMPQLILLYVPYFSALEIQQREY